MRFSACLFLVAFTSAFLAALAEPLAGPLFEDGFQPSVYTDREKVLSEIFDAIFAYTKESNRDASVLNIREDIIMHFGYISRLEADVVLMNLDCLDDQMIEVIKAMFESNKTPDASSYLPAPPKFWCTIRGDLRNKLAKSETLEEWVSTIEKEQKVALPLTRKLMADHRWNS